MVNEVVLEYLKKYKEEYALEDLKEKIVSSGYSEQEFEEALDALSLESPEKSEEESSEEIEEVHEEAGKEISKDFETPAAEPSRGVPHEPFGEASFKKAFEKTSMATSIGHSKWVKIAGISGILFLVIIILFVVVNLMTEVNFLSPFYYISFFLSSALFILFLFGFVVLGNKHDKKLIRVASWLFIILTALFILFQILMIIFPEDINLIISKILIGETGSSLDINAIYENLMVLSVILLSVLTSILLVFIILNVLFGIGLLKLSEVRYAKAAGILHIVGAFLFFVLIVAFIFEIILLFKASKEG